MIKDVVTCDLENDSPVMLEIDIVLLQRLVVYSEGLRADVIGMLVIWFMYVLMYQWLLSFCDIRKAV